MADSRSEQEGNREFGNGNVLSWIAVAFHTHFVVPLSWLSMYENAKVITRGGREVENYSLVCKQANINFAELSIKSCKFVNFLSNRLALQILQYFNNNHSESKKYTPSVLAMFL